MTPSITRLLTVALAALAPLMSANAQVGLQNQTWTISNASGGTDSVPGMIWYPTAAPTQSLRFGPFALQVAPGAVPTAGRHALVIVSHGTGSHELGQSWIAEKLAAQGYVVIGLRHPGDNYQDRSAVTGADYFSERPRQVSRVLDQVLADPKWAPLIDASRIAALGHSAGGYSVLALAGGRPDRARVIAHCSPGGIGIREDAAMCALGNPDITVSASARLASAPASTAAAIAMPAASLPDCHDDRIRAIVAAAPLAQPLAPESLAAIRIPVLIEYGAADEVLAPRFHAEALCRALPGASCQRSADAGHYAIFQAGTGPLPGPGGDPGVDPTGFDRPAWQALAGVRISEFLGRALR
jgi:predicted dienelactone hydrolase